MTPVSCCTRQKHLHVHISIRTYSGFLTATHPEGKTVVRDRLFQIKVSRKDNVQDVYSLDKFYTSVWLKVNQSKARFMYEILTKTVPYPCWALFHKTKKGLLAYVKTSSKFYETEPSWTSTNSHPLSEISPKNRNLQTRFQISDRFRKMRLCQWMFSS